MITLDVFLLGRFRVMWNNRPVAGLEHQKVQELFSYLLINPNQYHHRDKLANILWEECSCGRKYLRKALWRLQNVFAEQRELAGLLHVDREWLCLQTSTVLWTDIAVVENATNLAGHAEDGLLSPDKIALVSQATQLNRGEFLEGFYAEWCLFERERFRLKQLTLLDGLMHYFESTGKLEAACECGLNILQIDPARECTHRRLMYNHYLKGDRTAALRQYQHCVAILELELQVQPGIKTQMLYQQIVQDQQGVPLTQKESLEVNRLSQEMSQLKGIILNLASQINESVSDYH